MIKKCEWCGKEFEILVCASGHMKKKYCTKECQVTANRERTKEKRKKVSLKNFVCSTCGKPYLSRRKDSMTCSPECRYERDKQLKREQRRAAVLEEQAFFEKVRTPRRKPIKVTPAYEIEAEARKRGMNYGMYYALLQMEKEKERRVSNA